MEMCWYKNSKSLEITRWVIWKGDLVVKGGEHESCKLGAPVGVACKSQAISGLRSTPTLPSVDSWAQPNFYSTHALSFSCAYPLPQTQVPAARWMQGPAVLKTQLMSMLLSRAEFIASSQHMHTSMCGHLQPNGPPCACMLARSGIQQNVSFKHAGALDCLKIRSGPIFIAQTPKAAFVLVASRPAVPCGVNLSPQQHDSGPAAMRPLSLSHSSAASPHYSLYFPLLPLPPLQNPHLRSVHFLCCSWISW
eukprot:1158893-Pelagomonas_calceolata.AAC.19